MRKLHIIGIGAGNPDHVTVQAINAMNEVDVFFIPDKGTEKGDLKRLRTDIRDRFATYKQHRTIEFDVPERDQSVPYKAGVEAWHSALVRSYRDLLATHLDDGECGAFLVWGDPTLYDSTLRLIEEVHRDGFPLDYDVIPGISSVQALAARHRISLNDIGEPVTIMPGRHLNGGIPNEYGNIVVVLDGARAYRRVEGDDIEIFWGANVGTGDECLVAGRLPDVADQIDRTRQQWRDAKGWIMDIYLLRKARSFR